MMRNFHDAAAQVHAGIHHPSFRILLNICREQKSLTAVTNSQNGPVVIPPGSIHIVRWWRPQYVNRHVSET